MNLKNLAVRPEVVRAESSNGACTRGGKFWSELSQAKIPGMRRQGLGAVLGVVQRGRRPGICEHSDAGSAEGAGSWVGLSKLVDKRKKKKGVGARAGKEKRGQPFNIAVFAIVSICPKLRGGARRGYDALVVSPPSGQILLTYDILAGLRGVRDTFNPNGPYLSSPCLCGGGVRRADRPHRP